jgi:hypothetical protein
VPKKRDVALPILKEELSKEEMPKDKMSIEGVLKEELSKE